MELRKAMDSLLHYAIKDPRLGVLLVVLLAGLLLWALDRLLSLGLERIPLPERERGWLALAAPYFRVQGFPPGHPGGVTGVPGLRVRWLLKKDWGIVDAASARDRLDDLLRHGHRSDPRLRDPNQSPEDLAIVDRALLAWDGMRLVFVAR